MNAVEPLLRELAPQVLSVLVRRYGDFFLAEDAVQEALVAAVLQWPKSGTPDDPQAWLVAVGARRVVDQLRNEAARRRREAVVAALVPVHEAVAPQPADVASDQDDTLNLLFLCCHPALSEASRIALTLRVVGGLTTAQTASAFLMPEATMGQRISRAKQKLKALGTPFRQPLGPERADRFANVLHVLYLIFNEGYMASSGTEVHRVELTAEAIRLTRAVMRLRPDDGQVAGLLALMLLTDARRPARIGPGGELVPLAEQDRSRWDRTVVAEGLALIESALRRPPIGTYHLQGAIAAIHAEARSFADTDWPQIVALYELLEQLAPGPVVTLNHAVAVGMARGPQAGLDLLDLLGDRLAGHHRVNAVRGHLLEMAGSVNEARAAYQASARRTTSLPEQRYLEARAARLASVTK